MQFDLNRDCFLLGAPTSENALELLHCWWAAFRDCPRKIMGTGTNNLYRTIQNKKSVLKFREILDLAPQPLRLAYDPPEESNLGLKLRATFSQSITAGVAATFNGAVRRMQFAAANGVAYSMIPPIPILLTARTRTRGQRLGTAHALSRISASLVDAPRIIFLFLFNGTK